MPIGGRIGVEWWRVVGTDPGGHSAGRRQCACAAKEDSGVKLRWVPAGARALATRAGAQYMAKADRADMVGEGGRTIRRADKEGNGNDNKKLGDLVLQLFDLHQPVAACVEGEEELVVAGCGSAVPVSSRSVGHLPVTTHPPVHHIA